MRNLVRVRVGNNIPVFSLDLMSMPTNERQGSRLVSTWLAIHPEPRNSSVIQALLRFPLTSPHVYMYTCGRETIAVELKEAVPVRRPSRFTWRSRQSGTTKAQPSSTFILKQAQLLGATFAPGIPRPLCPHNRTAFLLFCRKPSDVVPSLPSSTLPQIPNPHLSLQRGRLDSVLFRVAPHLFDLQAISTTIELAKIANKPFAVALNAVPAQGRLGQETAAVLQRLSVTTAPSNGHRAAYYHCLTRGQVASEYRSTRQGGRRGLCTLSLGDGAVGIAIATLSQAARGRVAVYGGSHVCMYTWLCTKRKLLCLNQNHPSRKR